VCVVYGRRRTDLRMSLSVYQHCTHRLGAMYWYFMAANCPLCWSSITTEGRTTHRLITAKDSYFDSIRPDLTG
jgi:hypothetical protein